MSDTPTTDASAVWTEDWHRNSGIGLEVVPADFARQLERRADRYKASMEKLAAALREHVVPDQRDCGCLRCKTAREALKEAGL